ncbi:MAG: hypothetical protein KIS94_05310 [Chitinophagales bacterium]|nr:hypothetical protein [Chitinophagales bacterium]
MSKQAQEILTIQKFVFLLTDAHFHSFCNFLEVSKAALPLKLITAIRKQLPEFHPPDVLCAAIYGSAEESDKKRFNQLTSHTFRLTEYLAVNYPCYLHPNITLMQELVNEGKWKQAVFLATTLLNIADKVDDFKCQLLCCKFLSEKAFSDRDNTTGFKYDTRIEEAVENERITVQLQSRTRRALYAEKRLLPEDVTQLKNFLRSYREHEKTSIRILSLFYYLRVIFYYEMRIFESNEGLRLIDDLNKELQNHPYAILPFMSDVKGYLLFMQLNSGLYAIDSKERKALFQQLREHYQYKSAASGALSIGELHLMAVQSTQFLSRYHHLVNRKDYEQFMPQHNRQELNELLDKLKAYLSLPAEAALPDYQIRSLKMLLGAMLIISGGKQIKEGVSELESLLITYQQVNLGASTDSIFLALMVGYFSMADYNSCVTTFKRFAKVKTGKVVYEGNDLKIYAYYYLAQYLISGKKQFVEKAKEVIYSGGRENLPASVQELYRQFGVEL